MRYYPKYEEQVVVPEFSSLTVSGNIKLILVSKDYPSVYFGNPLHHIDCAPVNLYDRIKMTVSDGLMSLSLPRLDPSLVPLEVVVNSADLSRINLLHGASLYMHDSLLERLVVIAHHDHTINVSNSAVNHFYVKCMGVISGDMDFNSSDYFTLSVKSGQVVVSGSVSVVDFEVKEDAFIDASKCKDILSGTVKMKLSGRCKVSSQKLHCDLIQAARLMCLNKLCSFTLTPGVVPVEKPEHLLLQFDVDSM